MTKREEILKKVEKIEAIPVSAAKAISLLQNPDVNMSAVIELIQYESSLTANILKLVNSSAFAGREPILTLQDAAVRIGAGNLMQMLIGSSMAPFLQRPIKGYDLPAGELWKSAVKGAIYTEVLQGVLGITLSSAAFTAALLRDIGKVVLGTYLNVDAEEIIAKALKENTSFEEAEQAVLGIDHPELAGILLQNWKLPEALIIPVRWHHCPDDAPEENQTLDVVHVADAMTIIEGTGIGVDGLNYRVCTGSVERLQLTEKKIELCLCQAQGQFAATWERLNQ